MKYRFITLFLVTSFILNGQDSRKIDSLNHLIQQASQNDSWKTSIAMLYSKGKFYNSEKNYEEAQQQFLKIDSIGKKYNYIDENIVLAKVERAEISKSTFSHDGIESANTLLKQALVEAKKINNEKVIYSIYKRLADIKGLMGELNRAKFYLDLAFPYYLEKDDRASLSWVYKVYSVYYIEVDSFKKAEEYRLKRVKYLRSHNDSIELAKAISSLGDFYSYRLNEHKKALPYLEEAKVIYETTHDTLIRPYLYLVENLAICNAETGNYVLGYNYYKKAYNLRKDIVRESNDITTRRLEAKFQTKEKEQEIALLKSEKQITAQQKINQRNLFIAGITVTTIAGLFFFFLFKNKQKTTKKLKELDDFKSKLFANISHEFRTPLTLISGPIDKRLHTLNLSEEDKNDFEMIQRNSNRLLNLVDQLLDLSKLESGHLKLKVAEGNLSVLLKSMASAFQHKAFHKQIDYSINIEEIDKVWFDKDVIEKTVINLLSNAFKYTPQNGKIKFFAAVIGNKLELHIENDSNVLTKEQINNIFNRFYQADENTEGVGIGLSLVKEIVNLSYGSIIVDNTSAITIVFKVYLPILKSQFKPEDLTETSIEIPVIEQKEFIVEKEKEQQPAIDENLPILLVVDDSEDIRAFIKSAFKNNYQVVEASDGEIGVEKAIALVPDIIVSDVMMPKLNGFQLSETLKKDERTCHIPIILLTAKTEDADRFIGLETGADDYITKPFKLKALEARVKNLIDSRLKLRERYSQELVLKPTDIAISSFDAQFLEKVNNVIDENLTEPSFSAEDFSKAVGMSRMQLHRKLKALTGLSATEFVRSQRLKLAADLLKKSDANVSEIGYAVGFNDHSYFAKCFKEMYGCSPSEFISKL
ncbi:response regulator [Winogradskyella eximia]|jgi:signal transduction histidine kinase/DNA-binding response OmpR family regulator|uniref:response regulator n=1 Tax=Winogradskyella eximia TaxID=262006 RepID=UPI002490A9E4|nr:response regulator [Winogradskyella eximia]